MARAAISSANSASLSASPWASRVAVREHSRWIAARMTTSGSGTRSAVPIMLETKLMVLPSFAHDLFRNRFHFSDHACGGNGKNALVRD